jgi:hypothetical protein
MPEQRPIYNCHGILVGYIVVNEHGGSFFVQRSQVEAARVGDCRNMGINASHMREAFKNQGSSSLRRAFG